jgi:phosphoribosylcarboxyaminoimidazole (NCAIR) mutase
MNLPQPAKTVEPRQAAVLAAEILALNDEALHAWLAAWRAARAQELLDTTLPE